MKWESSECRRNPRESRLRNNSWAVDARLTRILGPTCVSSWLTERMEYANEKEGKSPVNVVDCDPEKGNTVDGVQTHVSEAFEWVIRKMMMPFAKMMRTVGSRGAVVGKGLDWEVRQYWMTFHRFSR
jgi:hypothetical protein